MKNKRILVISDPHCGHVAGLTHPNWQVKRPDDSTTKRGKWAQLQKQLWDHYARLLAKLGPFDVGFSLGDSIDGKGERSGGSELISADRDEQTDMAVAVHDEVRRYANRGFKWVGVFGTGYHVGRDEDWENLVAERAGFKKIGSHEWVDVNGCVFDLKHHVGGSTIPHGRHTAAAKERLWNLLWAERDLCPKATVILRGHTHYHSFCGASDWLAMTVPALQGAGTKYGGRRCSGTVDWGLTVFDVAPNGDFDWRGYVVQVEAQRARVLKV